MPRNLTAVVRDLSKLDQSVSALQAASRQPGTWISYTFAWQRFANFLAPKDVWKATPTDVCRWCAHASERGLSASTISGSLSGLKFHYEQLGKGYAHGRSGVGTRKSPTDDDSVRRVLRGIIRKHGKAPPKKLALLLDSIEKIMDLQPPNLKGLRNKALISLTWAACRRVSEVCALNIQRSGDGWIEFDDHGLVVVLRRSKANQDFRIEERYGVPTRKSAPRYCPVVLVRQWIEAAGIRSGPVFPRILRNGKPRGQQRLQGQGLWKMLKSAAAKIGLNPDDVSTHSLRAGCITWLYLEGVHPERIREQSGHKDLETLFKYIRPLKRSATSPLADTRWVK